MTNRLKKTNLKTPFNQIRSPLFFHSLRKVNCALIYLTLAKAVDDTDRKSRQQTNRFPSFILRVQEKKTKQVTYWGKRALNSNCTSLVLFCVKLEAKDKRSLFELILTKFFLLCEHNGRCWPTATFTDLQQQLVE